MSKLKELIKARAIDEADYMLSTEKTIRETAKVFGVSKSTVHKDLTERLSKHNSATAEKVRTVLEYHKQIRHIRGGMSTKKKYKEDKTA